MNVNRNLKEVSKMCKQNTLIELHDVDNNRLLIILDSSLTCQRSTLIKVHGVDTSKSQLLFAHYDSGANRDSVPLEAAQ